MSNASNMQQTGGAVALMANSWRQLLDSFARNKSGESSNPFVNLESVFSGLFKAFFEGAGFQHI
jgi:hypothetical protein